MKVSNQVQIDSVHSRAICDEIGERLRTILRPTATGLPARLQFLIDRLAYQDRQRAALTVPELDNIIWEPAPTVSRAA
ncbi:hypothetical protein [Bradyrhizobium sp. AUGA SZCCT0182]|uniref:hypothetical protein n=1 Tax=Bradyrhizobium sp. AUGA SZCCT0182 TaxID=2807667 RepID=UPI001BA91283|nr:hypothetical protein [Bradyrhizobium sp. AUGA SZCCT0182]